MSHIRNMTFVLVNVVEEFNWYSYERLPVAFRFPILEQLERV